MVARRAGVGAPLLFCLPGAALLPLRISTVSPPRPVAPTGAPPTGSAIVARVTRPRTPLRRPVRRIGQRAAALALPLLLLAALPTAAVAAPADDLPGRTSTFTIVDGILLFAVLPVGISLLVALVTLRPGSAPRAQRYRPGRGWDAEPSWSGPEPRQQANAEPAALPVGEPVMPVMTGSPSTEHPDSDLEAGSAGAVPGDIPEVEGQSGGQPPRSPQQPASGGPATGGGARGSW